MSTKVSGKRTSFMAKVLSKWPTVESIQEIGPKAKCMGEDSTLGHKDNSMRVLTKTT